MPEQPDRTCPACNICGFTSKAERRDHAFANVRAHRKRAHPEAGPQAGLNPGKGSGQRQEITVLAGAAGAHVYPNYFDGLLTTKFAELATTHHSHATDFYASVSHKRQLNKMINEALRGNQACAHGIDFCIWDAKNQCWVGSCKEY